MDVINILLVDDHELIRQGLKRLLDDINGVKVVAEANNGEQAIVLCRQVVADIVILEAKIPGIGGLETTRRLLRLNPEIKVIAISMQDDVLFPSRFLQAGVAGYLSKTSDSEELILAIRKVYSGQRYISPEIAQQLALKHAGEVQGSPFEILSERELQIMLMITSGQRVQEISEKLCLSPKTVNSYRYRVFDKLGISNDVELTHLAIRHGMLENFAKITTETEK